MAKKTRQEKIIADLRRKLNAQTAQSLRPQERSLKQEPKEEKEVISKVTDTSNIKLQTLFIKKDLTKTLLLTIIAISLELVLYFILRVGK